MSVNEILPPFRPVKFPDVDLIVDKHSDGSIRIKTVAEEISLGYETVIDGLEKAAREQPNKVAIAERRSGLTANGEIGQWQETSFEVFFAHVNAAAEYLLNLGGGSDTPVMIISGNSVAHAVVRFAALAIGAPIVPLSENYALLGASSGFQRLKYAESFIKPRFVFAENEAYAEAAKVFDKDVHIISKTPHAFGGNVHEYQLMLNTKISSRLEDRKKSLNPDAAAAYVLTSGSTGKPKAVVQTNRMMIAWVKLMWWIMQDTGAWDEELLEWLPWSHVSGLHVSIAANLVGASLYIDKGRPLLGRFDETIANIRSLNLRYFTNVPSGYSMLATALEQDIALRDAFFKNMRVMLFGGAGLPQDVYDRVQKLAVEATGYRIHIISGYGATETTSGCTSTYYEVDEVGSIGLPGPGVELKLVPYADRYELRVKAPIVTSGYLGREELNSKVFDGEGYFCTGDACTFKITDYPEGGLNFAGRMSEEFKLSNGTWVAANDLRTDVLRALSPYVFEVLICGENRDHIGVLAWPNPAMGVPSLEKMEELIGAFNVNNVGSSRKICKFAFLMTPPLLENGEMTDKGTVNQRLSMSLREEDVKALFAATETQNVLSFS